METRTERNIRLKKFKRITRLKRIAIIFSIIFMIIGLYIVNIEVKRKDLLENSDLFKLDISDRSISLLGEKYYIDFNIFSKYLTIE